MATAAPPSIDLCTVFSESKRIINAHTRHFLALSVFFLLPLSFSFTVYPTLQNLLAPSSTLNSKILLSTSFLLDQDPSNFVTLKTLVLSLLFSLFVFVFGLLAAGSITYSVLHGFYGRPVKLVASIRSALVSFFPLIITTILAQIIVLAIFVATGFLLFVVVMGIQLLGFQVELFSPYFIVFSVIVSIVLILVLVYLQVNWFLFGVIVVVESSWGLQPLKRSSFLIKGMRGLALALSLFFGFLVGVLLFISSVSGITLGIGTNGGWKSCAFVVQIVVTSTLLMLLLLYYSAANTILYMYCKAVHGELAWEIAEEFAREYISLPFDDGKVPHLVSVAYTLQN
ncbi:uncharacterized protein LOC110600797 [Manihot esculenta]|uniref:Glycerophosphoryl diester phosphodiesterase membrane domain-containing protein n=1 Tax=Manihot esculenta TaxID=3983 RepID=A0A2C9WH86_MANES|nr:uncharacterized protein LOC110600797 [Manihot esculenta]OAY59429.1 hypothetical protein MANES_01G031900v8 [Manihot esculenta]